MAQSKFPIGFYRHLEENTLTGIKAGKDRDSFLNIWMVHVDGRVFARSWGKSERSWFTALLKERTGQIKFGDSILDITGVQCQDPLMNKKIDQAYRARYTTPENVPYAMGITQVEYYDYTMEFLFREE